MILLWSTTSLHIVTVLWQQRISWTLENTFGLSLVTMQPILMGFMSRRNVSTPACISSTSLKTKPPNSETHDNQNPFLSLLPFSQSFFGVFECYWYIFSLFLHSVVYPKLFQESYHPTCHPPSFFLFFILLIFDSFSIFVFVRVSHFFLLP